MYPASAVELARSDDLGLQQKETSTLSCLWLQIQFLNPVTMESSDALPAGNFQYGRSQHVCPALGSARTWAVLIGLIGPIGSCDVSVARQCEASVGSMAPGTVQTGIVAPAVVQHSAG